MTARPRPSCHTYEKRGLDFSRIVTAKYLSAINLYLVSVQHLTRTASAAKLRLSPTYTLYSGCLTELHGWTTPSGLRLRHHTVMTPPTRPQPFRLFLQLTALALLGSELASLSAAASVDWDGQGPLSIDGADMLRGGHRKLSWGLRRTPAPAGSTIVIVEGECEWCSGCLIVIINDG